MNRKRLAQRLNLQRLPQEGVASMLAALGGSFPPEALVEVIYRGTEGNPFFVEEVFQHLEEEGALHREDGTWRPNVDIEDLDVPEGVRLVIGRRLERVSPDSQKVLTFGAVVGRGFSLELLEAIGDVTGDALLTALRQAKELPHRIAQPEVRRSYAPMLLDRKAAGDADRHGPCWARRSRCMGRSECPGMWRWRRGCYVSSEGHWFKRSGFESRRCRRHQRKTLRMDEV